MNRTQITETVTKAIALHLCIDETEVTVEKSLESIGVDSLDHVEIVMEIEDRFEIEITDEDAMKVSTVGGFVDLVEKALKK